MSTSYPPLGWRGGIGRQSAVGGLLFVLALIAMMDFTTTWVGIMFFEGVERAPIPSIVLENFGFVGMFVLKLVWLVVAFVSVFVMPKGLRGLWLIVLCGMQSLPVFYNLLVITGVAF